MRNSVAKVVRAASIGSVLASGCALSACVVAPVSVERAQPVASSATVPAGMQYLYGSGEAAAISTQAWNALVGYVATLPRAPRSSVVLTADATLAAPAWRACSGKPRAAVFDVDETVLLNLGFEADDAAHPGRPYDEERWKAWERTGADKVVAVPGARAALDRLRAMGVTVIFNTNRSAANADRTRAAIEGAGLGPAEHGSTLFLAGDDADGTHKDGRRATIASRYCVVAMGGDQLGDFSDLFNAVLSPAARRAAVESPALAAKWGAGWFMLPNPVYGSALKGGMDDVFPAAMRWTPDR